MNGQDYGHLAYLVVLLVAVGSYMLVSYRGRLGQMMRHALLWALIFVGLIAGIGLWDNVKGILVPQQQVSAAGTEITLPRQPDGHYYANVQVNGRPVRFLVDTGASQIVLTREAAREVGLDPDKLVYSGVAGTANGQVRIAPVRLDSLTLGGVTDHDVRAMVNDGALVAPLLGMDYLERFGRIEISGGALHLIR
ncbi:TIGR02281 family clan AA aspartic protease [Pseudooceanicola sp. CBS1P-1]|uniref:TIGR02281 family clan AA aspartic protease n=2 Tax=Paracoccaceae TaxID=31989 RepID=A0A6L7G4Y5_9RHOB|nr:TIGR02281 family clan AA aspartic protease [Pseudooceanicola endophyticus]MXN17693.1 TIGR02281 family clan AA aspartic protease [Pseudooceanicola albus]